MLKLNMGLIGKLSNLLMIRGLLLGLAFQYSKTPLLQQQEQYDTFFSGDKPIFSHLVQFYFLGSIKTNGMLIRPMAALIR